MPRKANSVLRRSLLRGLWRSDDSPVARAAITHGLTRQAVQRTLSKLVREGLVVQHGSRRGVRYTLAVLESRSARYDTATGLTEDTVWRQQAQPILASLAVEDRDICEYGVTEMVNNALDHSSADQIEVVVTRTAAHVELHITDNGIGVFAKIAAALSLEDPRHAALELSKGKFTTDPTRHTGEGLFFTARMFDRFELVANGLRYTRIDDAIEVSADEKRVRGTRVSCQLLVPTARTMSEVFGDYSSGPEDYRFAKTVVPIVLATFGDESLISRSSARRVLSRINRFDSVVLDYARVRKIGQAFADEIYRVFQSQNPQLKISTVNANDDIQRMIARARTAMEKAQS